MPDDAPFPVFRPHLPEVRDLLPYLERIDAARWYSNRGPLTCEFEERIAALLRTPSGGVITSVNGTAALVQCLRGLGVAPGLPCLMPAWTFVATPAAVVAAGLTPFFCDVDPGTWSLTPDLARNIVAERWVGAVIAVAPFGAPVDAVAWDEFTEETGVPVVIDAAASLDAYIEGTGTLGRSPTMISLHATKPLGVGEGAIVVTTGLEVAQAVGLQGNFGFRGSRDALVPGFNAKMSEYTAAVGLAALDRWPAARRAWLALHEAFADEVARTPGVCGIPGFGQGWVSSYGNVVFGDAGQAPAVASALMAAGIDTRRWWGEGCHKQTAYRDYPRTELPITRDIARRTLGLPFWIDMMDRDLQRIFKVVRGEVIVPTDRLRHHHE